MGGDEDTPSDDAGYEVLPGSTLRWPRWLLLLFAAVALAGVVRLIAQVDNGPSASRSTPPSTPSQPSNTATSMSPTTDSPTSSAPPVALTELGRRVLGVTEGWELFGRGDGMVVRIQLARGRITATTVPALRSGGPVSFVVGKYGAIIRPLDRVPGYLVPDGRPARELPAPLNQEGPVFPGPDSTHVWAQPEGAGARTVGLVGLDDTRSGMHLQVPEGGSALAAIPDGVGYLIIPGVGGIYDSRPDGMHRITTGTLLAVGPTRWLFRECNHRGRCQSVVVDRSNGARHILKQVSMDANSVGALPGLISPDGATAVLGDPSGPAITVHLRDLATGTDHALPILVDASYAGLIGSVAWSPNSRWLFIATADGQLRAVDARTGQLRELGIPLPNMSQIAVRRPQAK